MKALQEVCADAVSVSIMRKIHPSWLIICHGSCTSDTPGNLRVDFSRMLAWPVTLCHHPGESGYQGRWEQPYCLLVSICVSNHPCITSLLPWYSACYLEPCPIPISSNRLAGHCVLFCFKDSVVFPIDLFNMLKKTFYCSFLI